MLDDDKRAANDDWFDDLDNEFAPSRGKSIAG